MIAMQHVKQTRAVMGGGILRGLYNSPELDLLRNAAAPFGFR
jgi:hypothetical protein